MIHIAFDLYGTLLDTSSIAKKLESQYGSKAAGIAAQWRRYQLEYTWRLNSVGVYEPFSDVTRKALYHAVKEIGESVSADFADNLMKAYDSLDTFPDVDSALKAFSQLDKSKVNAVVFSNGTRQMVEASVEGSPSLKTQSNLFSEHIVIDEIPLEKRKYKPSPVTYQYLVDNLKAEKDEVWLVTSNPFDVDGAKRFGLGVCWVNRQGNEWIDGIGAAPDFICKSVEDGLSKILEASKTSQ